ncbi:MAG: NADH-quinone oxidoreductase subunit K, partial [Phycisphaerales bacterium]|nr:NADH-quinone oxidoreductase subunit K [Phycisphaerales bacterium]
MPTKGPKMKTQTTIASLLILAAGGSAGTPPFAGEDPATSADPLPQALILTAIVIG